MRTAKKAMRPRNLSVRVSYFAFLQRVLFKRRNTSSQHDVMQLHAVISFHIRQRVVFHDGPHNASFPAMYVVENSSNTTRLTQEISDGSERTILANTSQIAPFASLNTILLI